ncbi:MAG: twin-arginine translocase subunit TatC [Bryobacteraceae bacterium]
MGIDEERTGGAPPESTDSSAGGDVSSNAADQAAPPVAESSGDETGDPYHEDSSPYNDTSNDSDASDAVVPPEESVPPVASGGNGSDVPSGPDSKKDDDGEDEDGMLRMSFMEHLEELRLRLLLSLAGVGVAFVLCLVFANQLWLIVSAPAVDALKRIGADPNLAQITPMDAFTTIWVKVPMLAALFVGSPWVLYQVWAFIAPGLYKRERRWAGPFVICTAGLFILGGLFAYFVAFRFGLEFLLSIGRDINVKPVVSLTEYFDLFVNVTLGIGLVFELPVLLFFLTLLRIVNPSFLLRNTRYAILLIVVLAAIITPTPDVFNLMIFSVPMCLLYFVGIFASYLLVMHREHRRFPWGKIALVLLVLLLIVAGVIYFAMQKYGLHFTTSWPFLVR